MKTTCCAFHARADVTKPACDFCAHGDESDLIDGVDAEAGYDADPLIRQCADPDACVTRYRARHPELRPVQLTASELLDLAWLLGLTQDEQDAPAPPQQAPIFAPPLAPVMSPWLVFDPSPSLHQGSPGRLHWTNGGPSAAGVFRGRCWIDVLEHPIL